MMNTFYDKNFINSIFMTYFFLENKSKNSPNFQKYLISIPAK